MLLFLATQPVYKEFHFQMTHSPFESGDACLIVVKVKHVLGTIIVLNHLLLSVCLSSWTHLQV